ncbi:hypothetical protein B5S33_g5772 [[Candida] boidinii]|nr:hypothetical protein B5S33_g5772 [[Candida] boidinii]
MQDYIKRAENHFSYRHLKVVSVRTDNGTELKNFFDDRGISHERTVPYNSHQNGVAERMHRTIQEKARILLAAAGAAEEFWADAVRTAEFFVNRLPSSAINFEVPFTRWYGYSPDYSLFHSFGCSCHALIPPEKRSSKFSSTAIPAIFVGYSLSHKAYRIYDPVSNEIFISNNVRFDDSTYPWKEKPVFRSSSSHVVTGGGGGVSLPASSAWTNTIPRGIVAPESPIADPSNITLDEAYSPSEMSVSAVESASSGSSAESGPSFSSGVSVTELPPTDQSVADISSSEAIVNEPSSDSEASAPFPGSVQKLLEAKASIPSCRSL